MTEQIHKPLSFSIEVRPEQRKFVAIFSPMRLPLETGEQGGALEQYGMAVAPECFYRFPYVLDGVVRRRDGWVQLRSRARPRVEWTGHGDLEKAVTEMFECDARNVSRDELLQGRTLIVDIKRHEYQFRKIHGFALSAVRARVLPSDRATRPTDPSRIDVV